MLLLWILAMSIQLTVGVFPPAAEVNYSLPGDFILGGLVNLHYSSRGLCSSGPLRSGVERSEVMMFAVEQINNRTDLLPNVTLGLDIRDYCADESVAASVALSLIRRFEREDGTSNPQRHGQLLGIVGAGGSATSVATALVTTVHEIPTIGYRGSTIELSNHDRFPYFLRTSPPANLQARAIVDILVRLDWSYVGLIYSLDSYGIHGAQEIKHLAEENGICLAYAEEIRESATENDIQEIVDKIIRHDKATVIVYFVTNVGAEHIISAVLSRAPEHPGLTLVCGSAFEGFSRLTRVNVGNFTMGSLILNGYYTEIPGFLDYFLKIQTTDRPLSPWFEELLEDCMQKNKCPVTARGTRNHIMDAVYAFAWALDEILREDCAGNADCLSNGTVTGEKIISHLRDIKFEGVDGLFQFDANRDPVGKYRVLSLQQDMDGSYDDVELGVWDSRGTSGDRLDIQVDGLRWSYGAEKLPRSICRDECRPGFKVIPLEDKCCYGCQRCPENAIVMNNTECVECDTFHWPALDFTVCKLLIPSHVDWRHAVIIIVLVLASFGIILSFIAASGLLYYRQHPLIKATSRELSCVNILGLLISFLSVFLILSYPNTVSCSMSDTAIALSLTLTYAPTFLKVNRIYRIFTSAKKSTKKPRLTGPRDQVLIVSVMTVLQLSISIVSVIFAPSLPKLYQPSKFQNYLEIFCNFGNGFIASGVYNLLLILACCFYAFKTRKVPSNYNESKFIAVSVYSTLVLCLAAVPVYTTAVAVIQKVATLCMALILNAYLTLVCVYLPKLYAVRFVDDLDVSDYRDAPSGEGGSGGGTGSSLKSRIRQPKVHPKSESVPNTIETNAIG